MSIKRIDPGPRMSSVVVHNGVAYLAGEVASDPKGDITAQTEDVLRSIDESLAWAGTSKSNLLRAEIFLANIGDFAAMNKVWDAWVDPNATPARATIEARLARPEYKVEIMVIAAVES
jgi:enamine deaminase RidA (YjgF/YER057c/UK114 family)